jgi:hypothetical protein
MNPQESYQLSQKILARAERSRTTKRAEDEKRTGKKSVPFHLKKLNQGTRKLAEMNYIQQKLIQVYATATSPPSVHLNSMHEKFSLYAHVNFFFKPQVNTAL